MGQCNSSSSVAQRHQKVGRPGRASEANIDLLSVFTDHNTGLTLHRLSVKAQ